MARSPETPPYPHTRRDRRANLRVGIRVRVRLFRGAGLAVSGWARNISLGGIFVETEQTFPAGSECLLEFPIRDGQRIHTLRPLARVAWSAPHGMGLEFLKLTEEARDVVARLVDGDGILASDPEPPT
jgi:Tfp pilus assembly protein PilZ